MRRVMEFRRLSFLFHRRRVIDEGENPGRRYRIYINNERAGKKKRRKSVEKVSGHFANQRVEVRVCRWVPLIRRRPSNEKRKEGKRCQGRYRPGTQDQQLPRSCITYTGGCWENNVHGLSRRFIVCKIDDRTLRNWIKLK